MPAVGQEESEREPLPPRFRFHHEFAERWFDFASGFLIEHVRLPYWEDEKYGGEATAIAISIGLTWLHVQLTFRTGHEPAPFDAGDFSDVNQSLIEQARAGMDLAESMWRREGQEAKNPQRQIECLELARACREYHEKAVAFYSRWELRP